MNTFRHNFLLFGIIISNVLFGLSVRGETRIYNPIPISENVQISDVLSENDIPTGEGGFARDYIINLEKEDQIAIDLISEEFDSMLTLIADDGATIAENDDGPNGDTNSVLFARIKEAGKYIVRVRAFGETDSGKFKLKVTRLKPVKN